MSYTPRSLAGVSAKNGYDVNWLCVPRKAGEAIGGIARLRSERSGSSMTINVEYNQLDPLLRATVSPEGDVNDDSGWSPFPGESLPDSATANHLPLILPAHRKSLKTS